MLVWWKIIKNSKFAQGLIGIGIALLTALALIKKGESINQAKVDEEARKRDVATRERRDKANEKINSSSSSVTDWLHKRDRFRD
jgi:hypothetical protein